MKKNIFFLLLLLLVNKNSLLGMNRYKRATPPTKQIVQPDTKPKFVPKRMTDQEQERLSSYIQQKKTAAQEANDTQSVRKYEQLEALLDQLISNNLDLTSIKDEKKYTDYFNLVIAELESLGENPQAILQTTGTRQKLLEGKLEKTPWFVKEIEGLEWFFQQDAKQASLNAERALNGLQPFGTTQPQWPQPKDKALYLISLVDQIERNHQRVDTEDLAGVIETAQEYLVSFLPDVPNVFKRTIQEALNKLEKVRNIRGIPSLKE